MSGHEPSNEYLTILRALTVSIMTSLDQASLNSILLQIDHPLVMQDLVNQAKIETTILVEARSQGDEIMRNPPHGVKDCLSIDCFRVGGMYVYRCLH